MRNGALFVHKFGFGFGFQSLGFKSETMGNGVLCMHRSKITKTVRRGTLLMHKFRFKITKTVLKRDYIHA